MFSLFISNFGFEGRTLVPIASDPDHCYLFMLTLQHFLWTVILDEYSMHFYSILIRF